METKSSFPGIYMKQLTEYAFRITGPLWGEFISDLGSDAELWRSWDVIHRTVYPNKYAHDFCFAVLCCGYTLTDFPISTRLTSLALWQSNDCPSAGKATLMNMDKYFMWNHYERLHNHNKAQHNKTVCIFLGIYCNDDVWGGNDNKFRMMVLDDWYISFIVAMKPVIAKTSLIFFSVLSLILSVTQSC